MRNRSALTDYIVICETYVPRLIQIKDSVERIVKDNKYTGIGYLISKKPEHLMSAVQAVKANNVPYSILMSCPLEKAGIADTVQMVWEQFGLSHVIIGYQEGMELHTGSYKLPGIYGSQPVTVVEPNALTTTFNRLLLKYPSWSATVKHLNAERREADSSVPLSLQDDQEIIPPEMELSTCSLACSGHAHMLAHHT